MSIDREDQRLTIHEPGLSPAERGDNPETPAAGGSEQGIADTDEASGGSRGPSGSEPSERQ